jgi:hypothetical protein
MSHTKENKGLQKSLQQEVSSHYNEASYMITAYYALPMTLSPVTQQTEAELWKNPIVIFKLSPFMRALESPKSHFLIGRFVHHRRRVNSLACKHLLRDLGQSRAR